MDFAFCDALHTKKNLIFEDDAVVDTDYIDHDTY